MSLAETIYHHSLRLPEHAAQEALDFIQFLEQRYDQIANELLPSSLTSEQRAAYARLSRLQINWEGKPITDRDEANAH